MARSNFRSQGTANSNALDLFGDRKEPEEQLWIAVLTKAIDDAVKEGIKRADDIVADAAEFGKIASKEAQKKSVELRKQAKIESKKLKSIVKTFS